MDSSASQRQSLIRLATRESLECCVSQYAEDLDRFTECASVTVMSESRDT